MLWFAEQRRLPLLEPSEVELHPRVVCKDGGHACVHTVCAYVHWCAYIRCAYGGAHPVGCAYGVHKHSAYRVHAVGSPFFSVRMQYTYKACAITVTLTLTLQGVHRVRV